MPRDSRADKLLLVSSFYRARHAQHRQATLAGLTSSYRAPALCLGDRRREVPGKKRYSQEDLIWQQPVTSIWASHLFTL